MIYDDEEEYCGEDSSIHPDLIQYINLFNCVSEIKIDFDNERTGLEIKLEDGTWSFHIFYDVRDTEGKEEAHEKLYKSILYYLNEM